MHFAPTIASTSGVWSKILLMKHYVGLWPNDVGDDKGKLYFEQWFINGDLLLVIYVSRNYTADSLYICLKFSYNLGYKKSLEKHKKRQSLYDIQAFLRSFWHLKKFSSRFFLQKNTPRLYTKHIYARVYINTERQTINSAIICTRYKSWSNYLRFSICI